jgi:predicted transcriptional regulator of viral defense system
MIRRKKKSIKSAMPRPPKHGGLLNFIDDLQAQGRLVFTSDEAKKKLSESPNAFIKASLRLIRKDKLFCPTRGFYVIIPPEYRSLKSVPPEWYIDALMKFHGLSYYVGGLSAAAFHGAAHQSPQELQVVTTRPLRPITTQRTRIRFLTKDDIAKIATHDMKTHTGYFKVSTPEATAFDLVKYYRRVGYLNNVATTLAELSECLDPKKLVQAAVAHEIAHAQRLGYLLEQYGDKKSTAELHRWVSEKRTKFVQLRPGREDKVLGRDKKWRILINDNVEPDL